MNCLRFFVCIGHGHGQRTTCDAPFPTQPRWNVIAKAIVYYVLPLLLIGVLYLLVARRLHISARDMPGELAGPQSKAQARARRHVARMVVTFVIGECSVTVPAVCASPTDAGASFAVFIVCFLPHHVFMLWFHLNPNSYEEYDEYWHVLRIIGFCLG